MLSGPHAIDLLSSMITGILCYCSFFHIQMQYVRMCFIWNLSLRLYNHRDMCAYLFCYFVISSHLDSMSFRATVCVLRLYFWEFNVQNVYINILLIISPSLLFAIESSNSLVRVCGHCFYFIWLHVDLSVFYEFIFTSSLKYFDYFNK